MRFGTAHSLLLKASQLISSRSNERDQQNERSMARYVNAFNIMTGHNLSEEDGWLFMQYLKQSRSRGGAFCQDDYEDDIAYSALRAECAINKNKEGK